MSLTNTSHTHSLTDTHIVFTRNNVMFYNDTYKVIMSNF